MTYTAVVLIALVCLNLAFSVYQTRLLGLVIRNTARELDNSLAAALDNVISNLPIGDIEQPSYFQQVLGQIIQENFKPAKIQVKEVTRDDSGKFA